MAQHSNNFYGIAVGSSDIESLIGGGAYSMTKAGDTSSDFSSLLVVPDIPEYAIINSIKICCEGKQSRSNTSIYKSYVRFTPYLLNSYTINGKLYSSSIKGIIGSAYQERGTFKDSWNPYEIDLTSHNLSAADVRKGIRLALNMRFDGTTSLFETTASVRNIHIYVLFTIPEYTVSVSAGTGGTVTGGGTFEQGRTVTIKATPNSGYHFVKWSDGNTSASRTVTVSGNATYTAVFEAIIYTIKYVDNSGTSIVSASFGQEISARAISDKNITITYNETSSRGKTETYKSPVRGWKDSNSIVAKDGKTYTIDVFDAPFYANKYSDLYNVFGYNKYGLINHYIDYGLSEGRQCKPNSSEPCGVYLQDRTINSLSTTHGQQVVLEAVYEDNVLVTIGDISKSGYIFKGWQSPEHTELLQPGTQVYFTGSATLTAVWEAVDTPPEFTSASLIYADSQVSQNNKVPAGESCILSVGVT